MLEGDHNYDCCCCLLPQLHITHRHSVEALSFILGSISLMMKPKPKFAHQERAFTRSHINILCITASTAYDRDNFFFYIVICLGEGANGNVGRPAI